MNSVSETFYSVDIDFESINLPPVTDILVVGRKSPQGKYGILHSFELISPDVFQLIEIDKGEQENVEAVIINKNILKKIPQRRVIEILGEHIFPYVSKGEILRVSFNIKIFQRNIKGELRESEGSDKEAKCDC